MVSFVTLLCIINREVFLIIYHFRSRMARQEGQLLVNLKTNDVAVDIGKIVLGERSRKKTSHNQKRQQKLSIAKCHFAHLLWLCRC